MFTRGWRPAAGWVCVLALLWWFVLRDMLAWAVFLKGIPGDGPKAVSLDYVLTVLGALLGLGTLRTVEKVKGTEQ